MAEQKFEDCIECQSHVHYPCAVGFGCHCVMCSSAAAEMQEWTDSIEQEAKSWREFPERLKRARIKWLQNHH
jgi:hypothetical protein